MIDFQPILVSMGAAFVYSLLWYSRQVVDPTKPTQDYDLWQLLATLVVGAGIGLVSVLSGIELTQAGLESQLLAYGFVIAAVEQMGKAVYRNLTKQAVGA